MAHTVDYNGPVAMHGLVVPPFEIPHNLELDRELAIAQVVGNAKPRFI